MRLFVLLLVVWCATLAGLYAQSGRYAWSGFYVGLTLVNLVTLAVALTRR